MRLLSERGRQAGSSPGTAAPTRSRAPCTDVAAAADPVLSPQWTATLPEGDGLGRTDYGEGRTEPPRPRTSAAGRARPQRRAVGVVTTDLPNDFKGNPARSFVRQDRLRVHAARLDWSAPPSRSDPRACTRRARPTTPWTAPWMRDRPGRGASSRTSLQRGRVSALELGLDVSLPGAAAATPFVTGVDYDARGTAPGSTTATACRPAAVTTSPHAWSI